MLEIQKWRKHQPKQSRRPSWGLVYPGDSSFRYMATLMASNCKPFGSLYLMAFSARQNYFSPTPGQTRNAGEFMPSQHPTTSEWCELVNKFPNFHPSWLQYIQGMFHTLSEFSQDFNSSIVLSMNCAFNFYPPPFLDYSYQYIIMLPFANITTSPATLHSLLKELQEKQLLARVF